VERVDEQASPELNFVLMLPRSRQYGRISGVGYGRSGMALLLGVFYNVVIRCPTCVGRLSVTGQLLERFALQITFLGQLSEQTPELILLPLITLKADSTVDVPGKTVAMRPQNRINLEKSTLLGASP
jgi:hypothetical protein